MDAIVTANGTDTEPSVLAHEYRRSLKLQAPVFKRYCGMASGEQTKYVKVTFDDKLNKKWGRVELIQLTDVQFGHVLCNEAKFKALLDYVLEEDFRFLLLTGDMIDAAHINSPGGPYQNKWQPSIQLKRFCSVMAPVAHRCLSSIGGNHERRSNLYFGDLGTELSTLLEVPYSAGQMYVDVHIGGRIVRNELWHGRGAAASAGGRVNMIVEHMAQNPSADIIWVGHLHGGYAAWRWVKTPHPGNMSVSLRKQVGVMSPSFLDFWGVYGEVAGLSPSDVIISK